MGELAAFFIFLLIIILSIPASIASIIGKSKGGDAVMWFLYGFFLGPIAIAHAIARHRTLEEEQNRHRFAGRIACRFCDEYISPNAVVCPFCQRNLQQDENPAASPASASEVGDKTQSATTTEQTTPEEEQNRHRFAGRIACRFCDEYISPNAVVCPFCQRNLQQDENPAASPASASEVGDKTQSATTTEQTTLEEDQKCHRLAGWIACRFCDEYISPNAVVCPVCRRNLEQGETPSAQPASANEQTSPSWFVAQGSRTSDYNQADDTRNK